MSDPLSALRSAGRRCHEQDQLLVMARHERDELALRAVAEGHTWRAVADAAGFANPYLAALKRRADGGTATADGGTATPEPDA